MTKAEQVWERYKELLLAKRYDEWGHLWSDTAQFTVVYGTGAFGEEKYVTREKIVAFFSGARDTIKNTYFENDTLYKIDNSDAFFVSFDFGAITTADYHYRNRILGHFTLDAEGKIDVVTEYADPVSRRRFLQRLKSSPADTAFARSLVAQHLRVVDRLLNQYELPTCLIPTNVDEHGRVLDRTMGILNQSRNLYGVVKAYTFTGDAFYLARATEMAAAYVDRFINRSTDSLYFNEEVIVAEDGTRHARPVERLRVHYQAYGLAGLVAFCEASMESAVLADIRKLHDGIVERFYDPTHGGFFDAVNPITGENSGAKSFNSTVYVATSYLLDLVDVDPDSSRVQRYREHLEMLANLVVDKFVADEMRLGGTGFIRENFDARWEPQWRNWQKQTVNGKPFSIGIVGHNTQVAWFLLEMFERTNNPKYKVTAIATLRSMLERGYDWKNGGVYDSAKREESNTAIRWMWGKKKAWWQQAETIQALLQADKLGLLDGLDAPRGTARAALDKTMLLWDRFQRPEGGTFEEVSESGAPVPGPLDHTAKGCYHEAQVAVVAMRAGRIERRAIECRRPAAAYAEIRSALERNAGLTIKPLLVLLADLGAIDSVDNFGLTICMRAAALGQLDVIAQAHTLGASFEVRNPRTNANLLHYASQAAHGGAEIINWAILEANAPHWLLSERVLVQVGEEAVEGNGHTVAMEATFNKNRPVIRALIALSASGYRVDFTTPALTGWTPRGMALRNGSDFAEELAPTGQSLEEARSFAGEFAAQANRDWSSKHSKEAHIDDFVTACRECVLNGGTAPIIGSDIEVNTLYGRLGQPLLNLIVTDASMTSLNVEQQERYANVVHLLLQRGADPNKKEKSPMTVGGGFREAVFGYRDALARMIDSISDARERQRFIDEQGIMNGYTRLIDAALNGRSDIIELLLQHGADKTLRGFNGRTAHAAAMTYNDTGTGTKIPERVVQSLVV